MRVQMLRLLCNSEILIGLSTSTDKFPLAWDVQLTR